MNRHKLEQLRCKIGELLRFGSSSSIRQAHDIMQAEFENILYFAIEKTEPKPKPQHTIADNYPVGGIPEPCTFCENYEELENKNADLQAENERLKELETKAIDGCIRYREELKSKNELITAQKEYIVLLGEEIDETASFAYTHGWKSTRHEAGKKLRARITEALKEKPNDR